MVLCEELDEVVQVEIIASRIVEVLARPFSLSVAEVSISARLRRDRVRRPNQSRSRATPPRRRRGDVPDQTKRRGQLPDHRSALTTPGRIPGRVSRSPRWARPCSGRSLRIDYQPVVRHWRRNDRFRGSPPQVGPSHPGSDIISDGIDSSGRAVGVDQRDRAMGPGERLCRWEESVGGSTREVPMAVNMSAHQIMAPDCVSMICGYLADTETDPSLGHHRDHRRGADPRYPQTRSHRAQPIEGGGVATGTGRFRHPDTRRSAISSGIPSTSSRVDQSFIADVDRDESSHAIVSKTIEMAHLMDLTICEGVETAQQHVALTTLGSDFCQGFYFARPMASETLNQLMSLRN